MNRGDELFNQEFDAVFDENSGAAQTLAAWNKVYTEGLAREDNLVTGFADQRDVFASNKVPFIVFQSWHLKTINDPQRGAVAGNVMMVPFAGQPWGLLDHGGYSVVAKPADQALDIQRATRWVEFMGYRDKKGEILVAKQWVIQAGVSAAYLEVYKDPEVEAAFKTWMPEYPELQNVINEDLTKVKTVHGWKALWYPEWGSYAAQVLVEAVSGKRPVSDAIKDLKNKWDELRKPYRS